LIDAAVQSYQLRVAGRRLRLDADVEDLRLIADRNKLKLILDNLLSNAVKFSPEGGTVRVTARSEAGDLVLDVADEGPGVADDDRDRVFEPFYQGTTPQDGLVGGTGIGLSVVQEFTNAHGGSIELVDNLGRGAHFRLRLPMHTQGVSPRARAGAQGLRS
jgi:two-component system sensor histidine kinase GlrK